ncbi:unnamed protein product [Wuchereria bancrofti]|uniref:LamG-like jellyroll fold domain-containing protein n=1 Tax=Wuchereria bancrofti TaxID=6293 RepID=A0A3P7DRM8_WUCBA|nr:unnamed protein product [Wuchereria bancrofti]
MMARQLLLLLYSFMYNFYCSEEAMKISGDINEESNLTSSRLLYHTIPEVPSDHALYLNGSIGLRLSTPVWQTFANNMRFAFTLEIWVQIEGGQPDSATIIALNDICGKERDATTWRILIGTEFNGEYGARLAISLTPELAPGPYHIRNEKAYRLDEWIQIAIAYDSHQLLFYVNGARVGKLVREFGVLYSEIRSACKKLYLATDGSRFSRDQIIGFRGYIGKLRITDRFMNHSEHPSAETPLYASSVGC